MRDTWVISIVIIAAVSIGGLLYLYGGASFHPSPTHTDTRNSITILAQGADAVAVDDRVNYRITSADQLDALWQMVYGPSGSVSQPIVDFSNKEVLAVFDGSHSASGYGVVVNSVGDIDGKRVVDITYTQPDDSCTPIGNSSSPFVIVEVQKTTLPITHEEHTKITSCR